MFGILLRFLKNATQSSTIKGIRDAIALQGELERECIKNITDEQIMQVHDEVEEILSDIGIKRKEIKLLTYQMVHCIARDRLLDEIHGRYDEGLSNMRQHCLAGGYSTIYVKGRSYSGLT